MIKKETKITIWILIALVAILSIIFIGKNISRNQLESDIKENFMRTSDPYFTPINAKTIALKTIAYEYAAKNQEVYQNANLNLESFYQQILASSCLLNREEVHNGVKMIYRFYFRPNDKKEALNSADFLFLEVPISNETCRLMIADKII